MPRSNASRKGTPTAPAPARLVEEEGVVQQDGTQQEDLWATPLPLSPTSPNFLASLNRRFDGLPALGPQIRRIGAMLPLPAKGGGASPGSAPIAACPSSVAGAVSLQEEGPRLEEANGVTRQRKAVQRARWQTIDLRDGQGRRTLLLRVNPAPSVAFQAWDCTHASASEQEMSHEPPPARDGATDRHGGLKAGGTSASPASVGTSGSLLARSLERDRSVRRTAVPREIMRVDAVPSGPAETLYSRAGSAEEDGAEEIALDAQFMWSAGRKEMLLLMLSAVFHSRDRGKLVLTVIRATDGHPVSRLAVCEGELAELHVSSRAVVVASGPDKPAIHFICPSTWQALRRPIVQEVGLDPSTALPAVSLSNRLLAFVTTSEPKQVRRSGHTGPHGDLVTRAMMRAQVDQRHRPDARRSSHTATHYGVPAPPQQYGQSVQAALMTTAADLSSEMAKGMWTGLKGLSAMAINTASMSGRSAMTTVLSRSAPTDSASSVSADGMSGIPVQQAADAEAWPVHPARDASESLQSRVAKEAVGKWITILDLSEDDGEPLVNFTIPHDTQSVAGRTGQLGSSRVGKLAFSPTGAHLCAATLGGRCAMIVEVRPKGRVNKAFARRDNPRQAGEAWLRYEIKRGATPTIISSLEWDRTGKWIACGSARTLHLFAIHPEGGKPAASSHCTAATQNLQELQPLSVSLGSSYRIRGHQNRHSETSDATMNSYRIDLPIIVSFQRATSRLCETTVADSGTKILVPHGMQDLVLFHPTLAVISGHRLYIKPGQESVVDAPAASVSPHSQPRSLTAGAGAALSRPLLNTVSSLLKAPNIRVQGAVAARWAVPAAPETPMEPRWLFTTSRNRAWSSDGSSKHAFASIELSTCSAAPRILPCSIYADRSVAFSRLEAGGNSSKKTYRKAVAISNVADRPDPLDEPLAIALQTRFDPSSASRVMPALPNGSPQRSGWIGSAQVLHAAKDMVRRGRRSSQSSEREMAGRFGNQLSLDEETGFLYDPGQDMEDMTNGSSAEETPDDGWDDDLAAGILEMDDRVPEVPRK